MAVTSWDHHTEIALLPITGAVLFFSEITVSVAVRSLHLKDSIFKHRKVF